jgi:hypothetical protein
MTDLLFTPIRLGALDLPNRIVMAPLRARARLLAMCRPIWRLNITASAPRPV